LFSHKKGGKREQQNKTGGERGREKSRGDKGKTPATGGVIGGKEDKGSHAREGIQVQPKTTGGAQKRLWG